MLKTMVRVAISCLLLDLRWKAFSLSPFSMILAVDFFKAMPFIMLRKFPSIPSFLGVFTMKKC